MATILDKDLTRESTVKYDDREILVTLTEDQKISFKLKGMKSGILTIGIEELYKQLKGEDSQIPVVVTKPSGYTKKKDPSEPMISLYELRSSNMTAKIDMANKVLIEEYIVNLIKKQQKQES